ncbi:aspartyl protease family protein [Endozoicomonas sp. Mp262]|uniref:aspartyl protease family protein n=1 Tax=Endozoicomonas sp. Mp262 TaxID=2919499 RepID=UPI0021D90675
MRAFTGFRNILLIILLLLIGVLSGWLLHDHLTRKEDNKKTYLPAPLKLEQDAQPILFHPSPIYENQPSSEDLWAFQASLDEGRYDDALTLYQVHEHSESVLYRQLRQTLLATLQQWAQSKNFSACINALARFTQYYYQDMELLKIHSIVLESNQDISPAIEVCISARSFALRADDLAYFDDNTHRLTRLLFSFNRKQDKLESSLSLFQKLAYLEPDYSFYRYALAESYLAINDVESAVRELEALLPDHQFGSRAAQILAELFPPVPDEPEDIPPGTVPLIASGGHFLTDVQVGDKQRARLLIDTGASVTTLPQRILQELKRKKQAARVGHVDLKTASGFHFSPLFRVKRFQVGQFVLKDLDVAELDFDSTETADGLLGMNVLNRFIFQIDQEKQTLTLIPRY